MDLDPRAAVLIASYDSARSEMMARIGLRESSLLAYLGGLAALTAAAIQAKEMLFAGIAPPLCLAIAVIQLHHNVVIGALVTFCGRELPPHFTELGLTFPQWDTSEARLSSSRRTRRYRFYGDVGLILGPSIAATGIILSGGPMGRLRLALLALGAVASVGTLFLLRATLTIRHRTFGALDGTPPGSSER